MASHLSKGKWVLLVLLFLPLFLFLQEALVSAEESHSQPEKGNGGSSGKQIVITTGATNPGKTTVEIDADGTASVSAARGAEKTGGKVSAGLMQRLHADLKKAMPLNKLPASREIKSASFGTRTFISYDGQHSPDIYSENPTDERVQALLADVELVLKEVAADKKK